MKNKTLLTDVILVINCLVPELEHVQHVHLKEDGVAVIQFVFLKVSSSW